MKCSIVLSALLALVLSGCALQPRTVPEVKNLERKPDGRVVATVQNIDISFTNAMVATNFAGSGVDICSRGGYANAQPLIITVGSSIPGRIQINHKNAVMICEQNGQIYSRFGMSDILTYYAEWGAINVEFTPEGLPPVQVPIKFMINTALVTFLFYNYGYSMTNPMAGMGAQVADITDELLKQKYAGGPYAAIVDAVAAKRASAVATYHLSKVGDDPIVQRGWAIQRNGDAEQREVTVSEIPVGNTGKTATLYISRPIRTKAPEDTPKRSLDEGAHVMHGNAPVISQSEELPVQHSTAEPKKRGLGGRCVPGRNC